MGATTGTVVVTMACILITFFGLGTTQNKHISLTIPNLGTGKMTQWLKELAFLPGDWLVYKHPLSDSQPTLMPVSRAPDILLLWLIHALNRQVDCT